MRSLENSKLADLLTWVHVNTVMAMPTGIGHRYTLIGAVVVVILAVVVYVYISLLPKPIPGIPYNKASAKRVLGDIPDFLSWRAETRELWSFIRKLGSDLDSPVFQMFMRPFGKPWVIVTDFRESQDIQMSRSNDFDRAIFIGDLFKALLPGCHVWMPSNDEFKAHRQLIRDTMSPSFLNDVASPAIYLSMQAMISLWREKVRLAQGRPFKADQDIFRGTVDVILAATFGCEGGAVKSQMKLLSGLKAIDLPSNLDAPVSFPVAEDPKEYSAVRTLVDSVEIALNSPIPKQHLTFALKFFPSLVTARKIKDNMIGSRIQAAWKKFSQNADRDDQVKSAVDLLVQREAQLAKKEGREIAADTAAIRDELFGFLQAGHETTSTTLTWAVKYLTEYQDVQKKLRETLKSVHERAAQAKESPTAHEIVKASVPYLDAFIEENHRLGNTIPAVVRMATKDTVLLGYQIPKGTDVFMVSNGPSFQSRGFEVDESKRSTSSQQSKDRYGTWDPSDVEKFIPERWLVKDEHGRDIFDPHAGPVLPYGTGLRGCCGTKLAVLELKIIITLFVWNFELQATPRVLSSFKGNDVNTHRPQQVYLRLAEM